jgi:uncharacterized membrane protein
MKREYQIHVALIFTLMSIVSSSYSGLWEPIRAIFVFPLVIFLSGHLLICAINKEQKRDLADHIILSIGTSLALTILIGFMLNWTPWGLKGPILPDTLGIIALICGIVALLRKGKAFYFPPFQLRWFSIILFVLACIIAGQALNVGRKGALSESHTPFTQFWLVQTQDDTHEVELGIKNEESTARTYKLTLFNGKQQIASWDSITLGDQETWKKRLSFSSNVNLEANLYRNDISTPYRHVTLNITP